MVPASFTASAMPLENCPAGEIWVGIVSPMCPIDALNGLKRMYDVPASRPLLIAFQPASAVFPLGFWLPLSTIPPAAVHVNACCPCVAPDEPATTPLSLMSCAKLNAPPASVPMSWAPLASQSVAWLEPESVAALPTIWPLLLMRYASEIVFVADSVGSAVKAPV